MKKYWIVATSKYDVSSGIYENIIVSDIHPGVLMPNIGRNIMFYEEVPHAVAVGSGLPAIDGLGKMAEMERSFAMNQKDEDLFIRLQRLKDYVESQITSNT